jgi:hypothetical protein
VVDPFTDAAASWIAVLISFVLSYALKSIPFFIVGYDVNRLPCTGHHGAGMDPPGHNQDVVSTVLVVAILLLLQLAVGSVLKKK